MVSRSGRVGTVEHVLLDSERRHVTHFVVRKGLLLGRGVVVPADWITGIDEHGIFVDVGRDQLDRLPEYHPQTEPDGGAPPAF